MPRKLFRLSLAVLATCSFFGCNNKADSPMPSCFPAPRCYSGTVVAFTCTDGVLIDVDPAYAIGAPAVTASGNVLLGRNVVAVVNTAALNTLTAKSQRLYFTYTNDPNWQNAGLCCLAYDGVKGPVPHLVLGNVSTTTCGPVVP